ncbi:MAG: AMP-binding protein [Cytophagales bacterium]|nr:AMP-binding protein [Cytophagales bacterium]
MDQLNSEHQLGQIIPNIAIFLNQSVERFEDNFVYHEKDTEGSYQGTKWKPFFRNIETIAQNLSALGFKKGEKIILFSPNRLEMLELELAIMAYGGIAVPIFSHFKQATAELLINHSDATWMAVAGQEQMNNIGGELNQLKSIIHFDDVIDERYANLVPFSDLLKEVSDSELTVLDETIDKDTICLNMYTSGTMGTPKCVQLTHQNIMSQQAAISQVWDVHQGDRLLAFLPWHHSFGGIFELFTALYSGASYYLESSYGKDIDSIFDNWKTVKPTIFFSVPKIYQALYEKSLASKEAEDVFFNSGIKFIFTAAAPLPEKLSLEFQKRNIPVIEGWGLTETSPCCTLTDPSIKRASGVVGKPIPGVSIRIAEDDEILVKGPNVMVEYYNNDEANEGVFAEDGWYRTGDVGAITESGLKLISRKDRIFKLSNGEKVVPTDLEKVIELKCHYVQHVIVSGSGEEHPVALIFPNRNLLGNPEYARATEKNCSCPSSLNDFSDCLYKCLDDANIGIKQKFSKIKSATLIDGELSLDDNTLTPSMKVAPKNVLKKYKDHLMNMYGGKVPVDEEVYVVELDVKSKLERSIVHD